jgi:hypothetical protein
MSKYYFLLICVLPILAVSVVAEDDAVKPSEKAAKQDFQKSMLGAWVLLGEPGTTEEPEKGARMKFWGLGHWVITQSDPDTGDVIFHHGGILHSTETSMSRRSPLRMKIQRKQLAKHLNSGLK